MKTIIFVFGAILWVTFLTFLLLGLKYGMRG